MGGCVTNRPINVPKQQDYVQRPQQNRGRAVNDSLSNQDRIQNVIISKSQAVELKNVQGGVSKTKNQVSKQLLVKIYELIEAQIEKSKLRMDSPQDETYLRQIEMKELSQLYDSSGKDSQRFIKNLQQKISAVYIELSSKTLQGMNEKKFIENESKVFISQQILWQNLIIMKVIGKKQDYKFNQVMFQELNRLQKSLLGYLKMKYPRGTSLFVSSQLAKYFQNINMLEHPRNETLKRCKYYFGKEQEQPLMKDIKIFLNKIMRELDDKFNDFSKLLLQQVFTIKDEDGNKKTLSNKIGRKLPENTPTFNIDSRYFQIKSPQLLRVFIKWVEYLQQYFQDPETIIDEKDYLKIIVGFENNKPVFNIISKVEQADKIYKKLKTKLKQQKPVYEQKIHKIKLEIDRFNTNLIKIMDRRQRQQKYVPLKDADLIKYAMLNTNMLEWMIARKLMILMQALIKTGKSLTNNLTLDLISFNVTDLLRAMVFCQKSQIIAVYENIRRLQNEKMVKIVRIKNRLNTPLNDVMIIFRFRGCFLPCQLQLVLTQKTRSQDSDKIKNIQSLNHFLYQLERSPYGVQSELAALLGYKDNKTKYENQIKYSLNYCLNFSNCQKVHKDKVKTLKIQNIPFICTFCTEFYRENTNSFGIKICYQCNDFICSRCLLEFMKSNDKEDLKAELINNISTKFYQARRIAKIKRQQIPNVKGTEFIYEIFDFDSLTKLYQIPGVINSTLSKSDLQKFIIQKTKNGWAKYLLLVTFFNEKMKIFHIQLYQKQLELSFPQKMPIPDQLLIGVKDFIIPFRSKSEKSQIEIKVINRDIKYQYQNHEQDHDDNQCIEQQSIPEIKQQQQLSQRMNSIPRKDQSQTLQLMGQNLYQQQNKNDSKGPIINNRQKGQVLIETRISKLFDLFNKNVDNNQVWRYYYLQFKQKQEARGVQEPREREKGAYYNEAVGKKHLSTGAKTINILISVDLFNEEESKQKLKFPYNSIQQSLKKKPNILSTYQTFDLSQCGITDDMLQYFENTQTKKQIQQVNLAKNKISDVKYICDNLVNLRILFLQRNNISDIKMTQAMSKLQILNLSYNHIRVFDGLKYLQSLTKMDLSNNPLSEFSELKYKQKMQISQNMQDMGDEQIEVYFFVSLPKLQILNLNYVALKDYSILQVNLPQLIQLELLNSFNKINKNEFEEYQGLVISFQKLKHLKISLISCNRMSISSQLQLLTLKNMNISQLAFDRANLKYLTMSKVQGSIKKWSDQEQWVPREIKMQNCKIVNFDEFMTFSPKQLKTASIKKLKDTQNQPFKIFETYQPFPLAQLQTFEIKECIVKNSSFKLLIFQKLKSLSFISCQLQSIKGIENMNLEIIHSLNLSSNNLTALVPINLINLSEVNLSKNRLKDVSALSIWQTPKLKSLLLSENYIQEFPKVNFPQLKLLDLSNNQKLKNIQQLKESTFGKGINFNMQSCNVSDFPSLSTETTVSTLNLMYNNLTNFGKITSIAKLNISQNDFATLPKLGQCQGLYQIDASKNDIFDIKQFLPKISDNLIILDLNTNKIKVLPPIANKYSKLQQIILNNNYIQSISQFCIEVPYNLKILDCSDNQIVDFPKINGIGLTQIDLAYNMINKVDLSDCKLSRQCRLFLSRNKIVQVKPIQSSLKCFDLQGNSLQDIMFVNNPKAEIEELIVNTNQIKNLNRIPKSCILFYADENEIQSLGDFLDSDCDQQSLQAFIEIVGNVEKNQKYTKQIQYRFPSISIGYKIKSNKDQTLLPPPNGQICIKCNQKLGKYYYWCKWEKNVPYNNASYESFKRKPIQAYNKGNNQQEYYTVSASYKPSYIPVGSYKQNYIAQQQNVAEPLFCRQCIQSQNKQAPYKHKHNSILISRETKLVLKSMLGNDIQPQNENNYYNDSEQSQVQTIQKYLPGFTCIVCQQYFQEKGMPRYICLQYAEEQRRNLDDVCEPCMKKYMQEQETVRQSIPKSVKSFLRVQYQQSYFYY